MTVSPVKNNPRLDAEQIESFRATVYDNFRKYGRSLPWRKTRDPYKILISEVMLQQTQVMRVLEKYRVFIEKFPNISSLANASVRDILSVWQGLGYNRRVLALKKLAEKITVEHNGAVPSEIKVLATLPGIGKATAYAICAFAFNQPVVFVETNIRTVFIHHFFATQNAVSDSEILPLVQLTLDLRNPRRWYNALMDYGVTLKKQFGNPGKRSAHYQRQASFEGSNRQIRGAILRTLVKRSSCTPRELIDEIPFDPARVRTMLMQLLKEGLVAKNGKSFVLPS
ncbi:MAG: A/G-specific adenine glycosylase [Deltaproteobacteria bacterium]|nr:A/G-specific adenine glycosylase [Deltaproteobacteria bacterium]